MGWISDGDSDQLCPTVSPAASFRPGESTDPRDAQVVLPLHRPRCGAVTMGQHAELLSSFFAGVCSRRGAARWAFRLARIARFEADLSDCQAASASTCALDERIRKAYGSTNVALSRRHEGSRYRLAKVLEKARSGQKIKVAVLGGSGEFESFSELSRSPARPL